MNARKHNATGFTLLEVLISIVIIAFGLLGIAGLQAFALKNNYSASMRLTATALAADMVDRMKTNIAGVGSGAYNAPTAAPYSPANKVAACLSTGCTSAQMAANDLAEWGERVAAALPGGSAVVCLDSTPVDGTAPGNAQCDDSGFVGYVIKIWWSDDRTSRTPTTQLFWTAFNP